MAEDMRDETEPLEIEFWADLERIEHAIGNADATLGTMRAAVDLVSGSFGDTVQEIAGTFEGLWQRTLAAGPLIDAAKELAPPLLQQGHATARREPLREHFAQIFERRCGW